MKIRENDIRVADDDRQHDKALRRQSHGSTETTGSEHQLHRIQTRTSTDEGQRYRRSNSKRSKVSDREQQTQTIPMHVEITGQTAANIPRRNQRRMGSAAA